MRRFLSGRVVLPTKIARDQCECWGKEVGCGLSARVSASGDAGWSRSLSGRVGGVAPPLAAGRVVLLSSVGCSFTRTSARRAYLRAPRGRPHEQRVS